MGRFTFPKEERLSKEKDIQELFSKGSSFYLFPFKVLIRPARDSVVTRLLISVSKRNFKNATDRNTIKRRAREAYRLNKKVLTAALPLHIALIYSHREILSSQEISVKMVHVLQRILRSGEKKPT